MENRKYYTNELDRWLGDTQFRKDIQDLMDRVVAGSWEADPSDSFKSIILKLYGQQEEEKWAAFKTNLEEAENLQVTILEFAEQHLMEMMNDFHQETEKKEVPATVWKEEIGTDFDANDDSETNSESDKFNRLKEELDDEDPSVICSEKKTEEP